MKGNWTQINNGGSLGPLTLHADGSFSLPNGMRFGQSCGFENTMLGDARVDKAQGEGNVMTIQASDATHKLLFKGGQWFYAIEQRRLKLWWKLVACAVCAVTGCFTILNACRPGSAESQVTSSPGQTQTDARSVACSVLEAYRARNLEALAALSHGKNAKLFREISEEKEVHWRWNSLFVGPRWQAVQAWDGMTLDARYESGGAVVAFSRMDGDHWAVVRLQGRSQDGITEYDFEDIHRLSATKLANLSEKPE
jgi:hypothetical protein